MKKKVTVVEKRVFDKVHNLEQKREEHRKETETDLKKIVAD